jgi:DNA-binding PadR family transcriptional regulator
MRFQQTDLRDISKNRVRGEEFTMGTEMTDAELAILSLLADKPNYDHDLNRLIDARGMRRWAAIGSSSMYYVLEKLEKQGLIRHVSQLEGKRLFEISPAGIGVLQTAVVDLLANTHAHDKSFELGLVSLHVLKPSQVRSALNNRMQDIISTLNRLRTELAQAQRENSFQTEAYFSHRVAMAEAELNWITSFISAWEAQEEAHSISDVPTYSDPHPIPRNKQVILPQDADSVHKNRTLDRKVTPLAKRTEFMAPTKPGSSPEDPPTETDNS